MLKQRADIVLRNVHGSVFLIDITDNFHSAKCYLHELNPIAEFLWKQIPVANTIERLVSSLQEALADPVPYHVLEQDVSAYVRDLLARGYLEEVSE